jgi:hypothetical protein
MNRIKRIGQRGTALVELAIIMPLLLFLLLGVAEFGHAFNQYNILTKAVRNGARYLAEEAIQGQVGVVDLTQPGLLDTTRYLIVYGEPTNTGAPVLPNWVAGDAVPPYGIEISQVPNENDKVQISASYQYIPILGEGASLPTFGLGDGPISLEFTFHASVVMPVL